MRQGRVAAHYGLRFQEIDEPPPPVLSLKTSEHTVSFHFVTILDYSCVSNSRIEATGSLHPTNLYSKAIRRSISLKLASSLRRS